MRNVDFLKTYEAAVDRLLEQKQEMSSEMHWNMFKTEPKAALQADAGKIAYFSRCYDLTMTYLSAVKDIKDSYATGEMTHDESRYLLDQAQRIKNIGARIFNNMQNTGLYFEAPDMKPYKDFFNAFYNGEHVDMLAVSKQLQSHLEASRDVFQRRDNEKMSSVELGDACFKFASTDAFVKMAKQALSVDNENIYQLKTYINKLDKLTKDVAEKHAMESCLTDKGFVTHYAFALKEDKAVRDKTVNSVERYMLSTPGIKNKIAQEFVHVGLLGNKIATVSQQKTFGRNENAEIILDTFRGCFEGVKGAEKLTGSFSKAFGFFTKKEHDFMKAEKDTKDFEEKLEKALKNKMPQEILGRNQKDAVSSNEFLLYVLTLDAKFENNTITEQERKQREVAYDAIKKFQDRMKSFAENAAYGELEAAKMVEQFAKDFEKIGIGAFDTYRYDNMNVIGECDGERGMANLRLITYLMTHENQIEAHEFQDYQEALHMLHETFGADVEMKLDMSEPEIDEIEHE